MFLERVSKFDKMKQGMCPNRCGSLTIMKRRQAIMYMIPMELIEELENKSEGMYGYVAGVCPECGFILITDNKEAETANNLRNAIKELEEQDNKIYDAHEKGESSEQKPEEAETP